MICSLYVARNVLQLYLFPCFPDVSLLRVENLLPLGSSEMCLGGWHSGFCNTHWGAFRWGVHPWSQPSGSWAPPCLFLSLLPV